MSDAAPEAAPVPERLSYTSPPALMTAVVLSIVLLSVSMFGWWAIGEEIRDKITWPQAGTLLFFVFLMIGIMLSIGYSRLWADERGVIVRNGPFIRRFTIAQIAGVRLRPGDAWTSLLLKTGDGEEPKRQPVLAIQFLEGEAGRRKVVDLRRWLVARGAGAAPSTGAQPTGDTPSAGGAVPQSSPTDGPIA
ncbi:hypothetical protein [Tessaracoccus palaemonis]|uniref:PH domain-containing protein n=1 Tax=Tessaracoccus palaemonis TaxID=2829499 RepID=A0ABX8SRR2_9ACTN|nr:hypothetical protein [Tessaracoccus palaemonis]QXT63869.1 hypothetical protein KDB89_05230 [Tessaracoccus palaemonis]